MSIRAIFRDLFPRSRLNRSLRILITINAIFVFVMGLFLPFYAVFVQKIGGSIAFAGFSWALFQIVSGLLIFLLGNLEVRVREQELLLATSYFLRAAVFISYTFMSNMAQLIATQLLWGVSAAFGTPAFDATYAQHTSREDSILQWGNWEGIAAMAAGVAALIGGAFIQKFGFVSVFVSMAVISASLGLYIWLLPRDVL